MSVLYMIHNIDSTLGYRIYSINSTLYYIIYTIDSILYYSIYSTMPYRICRDYIQGGVEIKESQ